MKITKQMVENRKILMEYEKKVTGEYLLVGNGESQQFWRQERYKTGNRWWKLWNNKTDLEIASVTR